jgi:hypothetical protein
VHVEPQWGVGRTGEPVQACHGGLEYLLWPTASSSEAVLGFSIVLFG